MTNSMKIRHYIKDLYNFIGYECNINDKEKLYELICTHIELGENPSIPKLLLSTGLYLPNDYDLKQLRVLNIISYIQMYTDYYMNLKYTDYQEGTNKLDHLNIKSYEDIKKKFFNRRIAYQMMDSSLDFISSSAYEKIISYRLLDKNDCKLLSSINMFFEDEKGKYDIDIDLNFLYKQISKWQNAFEDQKELSFFSASMFLYDLYNIDKEDAINVISDLLNTFDNEIFISNSNLNEETIMDINGILIDDTILAGIIKDSYSNTKKLQMK